MPIPLSSLNRKPGIESNKSKLAESLGIEKSFITSVIENCTEPSENRIEFKNLAKSYLKYRKRLQFSANYSDFLTSVLEMIISKHVYKYSSYNQGFYLSNSGTTEILNLENLRDDTKTKQIKPIIKTEIHNIIEIANV